MSKRHQSMIRLGVAASMSICMMLTLCVTSAFAEKSRQEKLKELRKKEKMVDHKEHVKSITGEVMSVSASHISVEYYRHRGASKEIVVPLDGITVLSGIQSVEDLQFGDTVQVGYSEVYDVTDEGKQKNFKRVATELALLRRTGTGGLRSLQPRMGTLE